MNVLITGVTGFAAAHLTAFCAGQGCSITGLGRRDASEADLPPELSSYEVVDLSDGTRTRQAVRAASPELVFHLAADSSVAESWKNPVGVIDNNVMSTLNVLEAVRHEASGARVLVACSGEEYGEPESLPVTERHPLRPRSPYALSKASVDLVAGFYADAYGTHAIRTRAFNHVGPGQSDGSSSDGSSGSLRKKRWYSWINQKRRVNAFASETPSLATSAAIVRQRRSKRR